MPTEGITFAVDDVAPATARLAERELDFAALLNRPVLASAPAGLRVIVETPDTVASFRGGVHPLLAAVHAAFSDHRPLVLTPDALWMTIAQGFALHIDQNADAFRHRFVRHRGQKTLAVRASAWGDAAAWEGIFAQFAQQLGEELGPGLVQLVTRPFSTTGAVERVASQIVLMDAFKHYFDYVLVSICGIPRVTLAGTADDWVDLRRRVDVIAEFDLEWWAAVLRPVCDQWVAAARGQPDTAFWRAIYKPESAYGGDVVTGWIVRLFPYLEGGASGLARNTFAPFTVAEEPPRDLRERFARWKGTIEKLVAPAWTHEGFSSAVVPRGLSRAPVRLEIDGTERSCEAVGGFVGVVQDSDGLALRPAIGWAVCESPTESLWDALRSGLRGVAEGAAPEETCSALDGLPALLVEFYDRFHDASLFDGAMRIRPRVALAPVSQRTEAHGIVVRPPYATRFADLADGSFLAFAMGERDPSRRGLSYHWSVLHLRAEEDAEHPERVRVVARSMLELFQKLVAYKGVYFLDPLVPTHGTLADLLPRA